MCSAKDHVLIFCLLFIYTEALTCRSDGGPKESELKSIYNKCLKMQDGKNFSSNRDEDWNNRHQNQNQNDWDRDGNSDRGRSREERSGSRSDRKSNADGRMGYDDHSSSNYGSSYDRSDEDRMGSDRMGSDRMGNDRMSSSYMGRYGRNGNDDSMSHDSGYGGSNNNYNNRRSDYQQEDYGSGLSNQYGYQSSTQSSRRYKREHRPENSGQRSQFNPNSKRSNDDSYQSDERSSKENDTKNDDKKACALHCFLDNLEMTAEDGMPDRYLVTHALTKDVNNEDLKDFLQESIEECFQILDNENTEEKCEFSKNLLMCLSEKGRANCDDWKDELRF